MGGLFGGGAPQAAPLPAPLPERDDPAIKQARDRAKLDAATRRGRRATILTGGSGVEEEANVNRPAPTADTTTVLGGSA
jgi:hypothetical protein